MRNQNVHVFVCSVSYYYGCVHIWVCRQWRESNLWLAAFPSKSGLFVAIDATGDYRMLPAGKIFRPDEKVKPERVWIFNPGELKRPGPGTGLCGLRTRPNFENHVRVVEPLRFRWLRHLSLILSIKIRNRHFVSSLYITHEHNHRKQRFTSNWKHRKSCRYAELIFNLAKSFSLRYNHETRCASCWSVFHFRSGPITLEPWHATCLPLRLHCSDDTLTSVAECHGRVTLPTRYVNGTGGGRDEGVAMSLPRSRQWRTVRNWTKKGSTSSGRSIAVAVVVYRRPIFQAA